MTSMALLPGSLPPTKCISCEIVGYPRTSVAVRESRSIVRPGARLEAAFRLACYENNRFHGCCWLKMRSSTERRTDDPITN
jgi:hypothetical protein